MTSEMWLKAGKAIFHVAWVALLLGAGLPTIFALGMRSLGHGRAVAAHGGDYASPATTSGRIGAIVAFTVVSLAVVFGIVVIVFGKQIFS